MTTKDLLAQQWELLAELTGRFSDEEWAAPTACAGWSVKDHLSHLVGTESMLLGRPSPPPAAPVPTHVRNAIGENNEAWVDQRRARSGPEVRAEFMEVTRLRVDALQAMSDEEWSTLRPSPIGVVPYSVFMEVRLMDCWVHEQDMRAATGRPPRCDGPEPSVAIDRLNASFAYVVGKRADPPEGATVTLELTGPAARTIAVVIRDGRAVPIEPPFTSTAALIMATPDYVAVATGRRHPADVYGHGLVTMRGDTVLAHRILENLPQMP